MTNSDDLRQQHPRYAIDVNRMYDLRSTARISELLALPIEDRSVGWTEAFFEAAWNGSIEIPRTPFFEGPDGYTYLRLDVPRPGLPFESNCLARQAEMLLSTARGAALFASPDATEPAYVFPVGVIDAMVRFDSHQGDPIDLAEIMQAPHLSVDGAIQPNGESLVGSPSREFLPPHTAKGLHRHLVNGWGIAAPRVALMVLKNAAPSRNLVIDRTIDEIPGDARHAEAVVRMLLWYLPPRRSILLRPPSLAIRDMKLLSDYFE